MGGWAVCSVRFVYRSSGPLGKDYSTWEWAILSSAQLKPHLMRWLCCLLQDDGKGTPWGPECHSRLVNWRREHYLWLYPDGNWYAQGGSVKEAHPPPESSLLTRNPLQGCSTDISWALGRWADKVVVSLAYVVCLPMHRQGWGARGQAAGKCLPTSPLTPTLRWFFCQQTELCCLCFWLVGIFCPAASAIVLN